ncbi:hypothetical protein F0562_022619 [Nyssa sinensis]|uniref:Uncharacterized protein n=1 Tax=Nyssa sinensis TaxID=561372 RepID=A0A5J5BTN0_9ASTE|nr:hypothetical protein F0562_022619 [Nyssa sinensis]
MFLKGKELSNHIDSSVRVPTDEKEFAQWEVKDAKVPTAALAALQAVHAESQRDQFLMKLRSEFELVRAGLLNRTPVPSLDICLGDFLREEQQLSTQLGMTSEKVFSEAVTVAYAAQGRGRNKL